MSINIWPTSGRHLAKLIDAGKLRLTFWRNTDPSCREHWSGAKVHTFCSSKICCKTNISLKQISIDTAENESSNVTLFYFLTPQLKPEVSEKRLIYYLILLDLTTVSSHIQDKRNLDEDSSTRSLPPKFTLSALSPLVATFEQGHAH